MYEMQQENGFLQILWRYNHMHCLLRRLYSIFLVWDMLQKLVVMFGRRNWIGETS